MENKIRLSKSVTCNWCNTKQTVWYVHTKGPAQAVLQTVECANPQCRRPVEVEVPGAIVEPQLVSTGEPTMDDELARCGGDSAELHD